MTSHDAALAEVAKYLSPTNENVKRGDLISSIRDLAQIAIGYQSIVEAQDETPDDADPLWPFSKDETRLLIFCAVPGVIYAVVMAATWVG